MRDFPAHWRGELLQGILATGTGHSEANEIVDLAMHAVSEAMGTIADVTTRASKLSTALSALHMASQLLGVQAAAYSELTEAMLLSAGASVSNIRVNKAPDAAEVQP